MQNNHHCSLAGNNRIESESGRENNQDKFTWIYDSAFIVGGKLLIGTIDDDRIRCKVYRQTLSIALVVAHFYVAASRKWSCYAYERNLEN